MDWSRMTSRHALWLLILVSTLLRLGWAASVELGNDEAYHYLFATHLDWSYFDHPPMLAAWWSDWGSDFPRGVASALGLRIGFILLFAGSTWLLARLTERFYGPRAGWLAAFALNVTAYHSVAVGTFVLPDGPLLFFWLLTLDRLAVALDSGGRLGPWLGVGLAWARRCSASITRSSCRWEPCSTRCSTLEPDSGCVVPDPIWRSWWAWSCSSP